MESCTSSSHICAPASIAPANAGSVFSGNSPLAPRWAIINGRATRRRAPLFYPLSLTRERERVSDKLQRQLSPPPFERIPSKITYLNLTISVLRQATPAVPILDRARKFSKSPREFNIVRAYAHRMACRMLRGCQLEVDQNPLPSPLPGQGEGTERLFS